MPESDPRDLMIAHLPRLRRFARGLTGSAAEGDDLVQAACMRALEQLDRWQPGTRMDAWLYQIARNLWIDSRRSARVRTTVDEPIDEIDPLGCDGRRIVEERVILDQTRRAIADLPDDQREVLLLVAVEGLSYREASATLDIKVGTVMSRLARGRAALVDRLGGVSPFLGMEG